MLLRTTKISFYSLAVQSEPFLLAEEGSAIAPDKVFFFFSQNELHHNLYNTIVGVHSINCVS